MSFREVDVFAPSPRTEMMTATNSAAVAKLNGGGSRNPLEKSESHENLLSD
ncbi:unnamed protein product [Amoebophrya sp. A120]|nr:unnamed protein product [Amoebophrya sp. A120]|eukprot:GSA120T00015750001.1